MARTATVKMAKLMLSHEEMHRLLNLPEDVTITSMHTTRGEEETGIYMMSDRFPEIPEGATTPAATRDQIENFGLWENENNV